MRFLKENWIWIVAPIVLVALAIAAVVLFGSDTGDPHVYQLR